MFHSGSVYTPQFVIDGRLQAAGNDVNAVRRAIALAAHDAKARVGVTAQPATPAIYACRCGRHGSRAWSSLNERMRSSCLPKTS